MNFGLVVFLALSVALCFRFTGGQAHVETTVAGQAQVLGYRIIERRPLTAGGSYRALRMGRHADRCEIVAIEVDSAGEFWSVVPPLVGEAAWRSGRLWDAALHPLPSGAVAYLSGRYLRRLQGQETAMTAAVVFAPDRCLAEWVGGIAD